MELGKQIKFHREQNGLTQEKLAEKIYVSRQSISNWETEKSYPDIHSILRLSVLFNVSLDELVKGDVDMMKREIEKSKLNFWVWGMVIGMALMALSIAPSIKFLGIKGFLIPLVFAALMLLSGLQAEKIKKKNNLQTYAGILAYMQNRETSTEENRAGKSTFGDKGIVKALIGAGAALILTAIGFIIFAF